MKRTIALFLFVLLFSLCLVPVIAQEATPEFSTNPPALTEEATLAPTEVLPTEAPPSPEPTTSAPTPEPVVSDQVSFRVGIFGFVAIVITLMLSGFGIGAIWGSIRASKAAKDELERAYNALSPDAQAKIDLAHEQAQKAWDTVDTFARQVLSLWTQVTDKQPNVEGDPQARTSGILRS